MEHRLLAVANLTWQAGLFVPQVLGRVLMETGPSWRAGPLVPTTWIKALVAMVLSQGMGQCGSLVHGGAFVDTRSCWVLGSQAPPVGSVAPATARPGCGGNRWPGNSGPDREAKLWVPQAGDRTPTANSLSKCQNPGPTIREHGLCGHRAEPEVRAPGPPSRGRHPQWSGQAKGHSSESSK